MIVSIRVKQLSDLAQLQQAKRPLSFNSLLQTARCWPSTPPHAHAGAAWQPMHHPQACKPRGWSSPRQPTGTLHPSPPSQRDTSLPPTASPLHHPWPWHWSLGQQQAQPFSGQPCTPMSGGLPTAKPCFRAWCAYCSITQYTLSSSMYTTRNTVKIPYDRVQPAYATPTGRVAQRNPGRAFWHRGRPH